MSAGRIVRIVGLIIPDSAEGTWVMCLDPSAVNGGDVKPVYIEPRVVVSPFKLETPEPSDEGVPKKK